MAQVMGKHIEDCLMNTKITEEGKTEVFAEVERLQTKRLDNIYGSSKKKSLQRLAAEGVVKSSVAAAKIRIIQWRIEKKARPSCASVLSNMKRGHIKTHAECDRIYDKTHHELEAFIEEMIPDDVGLGLSFASKIMDGADDEIRVFKAVKRERSETAETQYQ